MADGDYYDILGLSRNASNDEIRRAYRSAAKKYHPDQNPGDNTAEANFKRAQEAYEVLGDKSKRAQYDRFGRAGVGRVVNEGDRQYYTWGGGSTINLDELDDLFTAFGGTGRQGFGGASIFEHVFGKRSHRPARRQRPPPTSLRGQDVQRPLNLTFEQAIGGTQVDVELGAGKPQNRNHQTLSVRIPPNVPDGQRIRLAGKGAPGQGGGPPGDLFIICKVQPHPYFRRQGSDIYLDLPITFPEAALGAKIDVPTLNGTVTVAIPPGTGSGAILRLKGRGISTDRGDAGDQFVVIQITSPKNLNDRQREAIKQVAGEIDHNPRAALLWSQENNPE